MQAERKETKMNTNVMNWISEENNRQWRAKAIECEKKHQKFEKGKTIIHEPHPNSPRCVILKYQNK